MVFCKQCGVWQDHLGRHLGKHLVCQRAYYLPFDAVPNDDADMEGSSVSVRALWQAHHQRRLDKEVFKGLSEMVWIRYVPQPIISTLIKNVRKWIEFVLLEIEPDLQHMIGADSATRVLQLVRARFDFFKNLDTHWKREQYALTHCPVLPIVELTVGPSKKDLAYVTIIVEWIVGLMKCNPQGRLRIVAQSELYKSGTLRQKQQMISDWIHGTAFQKHENSAAFQDKPGYPPRIASPPRIAASHRRLASPPRLAASPRRLASQKLPPRNRTVSRR